MTIETGTRSSTLRRIAEELVESPWGFTEQDQARKLISEQAHLLEELLHPMPFFITATDQTVRELEEKFRELNCKPGPFTIVQPEPPAQMTQDAKNKIRRMVHRLNELLHIGWGPQELRQVRRMLVDQNELLAEIAGVKPEPQQIHNLAQI